MEVLAIIDKHSIPTKIMSAANLSWRPFQVILTGLIISGLVKETILRRAASPGRNPHTAPETVHWKSNKRTRKIYSLTDKGREALSLSRDLNTILGCIKDEDIPVPTIRVNGKGEKRL